MPTTILLCRHATVENPKQLLYGRLPGFVLSERGRSEAQALGRYLAPWPVAAIYASPLERAQETARAIASHHPDAAVRRAGSLLEVRNSWEGSAFREIGYVSYYDPPRRPGDETMTRIARRMHRFLRTVARCHRHETVVTVSHGDPIAIFVMSLFGKPLTEQSLRQNRVDYPDLASVNRFLFADDGSLLEREYLTHRQVAAGTQPLALAALRP